MSYSLATFHDINYIDRAICLYRSLGKYLSEFELYVVCLDDLSLKAYERLGFSKIVPIPILHVERRFPELKSIKEGRSLIEYYFTLSPFIPSYIFSEMPAVNKITTLDSDLYFFSSPKVLLDSEKSIQITPHNFPRRMSNKLKYGKFNVSYQSFRRNESGLKCLQDWKQQCLDWCFDYYDGERFADQKYLDKWEKTYGDVEVINHLGAGVAPWNITNLDIRFVDNQVMVADQPLIYYHFHHLRFIDNDTIIHGLNRYGNVASKTVTKHIYGTYIRELIKTKEVSVSSAHRNNIETKAFRKAGHFTYDVNKDKLIQHVSYSTLAKVLGNQYVSMIKAYLNL